ncbi:HamA C-terminal domain-containing protein [Xenorhabdus budapestensis]|uniref:Anti-bacteriophage protein A/HamA C-terminal domain-containing protein n=1 Tax=Xenorhabdus budapestensis TaxID=290110 RepID=A0A2D0IR65_XENBU|nr:DUF1837 domain-containing protein [Xenorhabdus budapestensis]PHM24324.1 hypothetical protein Xbud_03318 [Xenorhabdus budapestensis]
MEFKILIDESFLHLCNQQLSPINNKNVLSMVNDFEDGCWRFKRFQNFIWDNIAETSLSSKERRALVNQSHTMLIAAAEKLRLTDKNDDISKGSELAEIVLYGIMKHHYKALPVVPKIFYKQNTQDNAKGADSVHLVIRDDDFSLWFGEAKFYNSIENARLDKIITSVGNSLRTDKLKKENSIITNVNDIDCLVTDIRLREKIKDALSNKNSIDSLKPKIHVPIFILHECQITQKATAITFSYEKDVYDYHVERANIFFNKQINKLNNDIYLYDQVTFHIILFPVPDKNKIVDKFVSTVEFYREN